MSDDEWTIFFQLLHKAVSTEGMTDKERDDQFRCYAKQHNATIDLLELADNVESFASDEQ